MSIDNDLKRIEYALNRAKQTLNEFTSGRIEAELKAGGDPVTAADLELDRVLRETLCEGGDGWLSEETADDLTRLDKSRVWIVDPIDGTREFIQGIDEWCVSIALVENCEVVTGGIYNTAREQLFLGSRQTGVTLNGRKATVSKSSSLEGAQILASRSEVKRGEWKQFEDAPFEVIPCGSVAYKLAQVSAGLADATFTLVPKNEWDIAAGVILVEAAGGKVTDKQGRSLSFNRKNTLFPGIIASGQQLFGQISNYLIYSN